MPNVRSSPSVALVESAQPSVWQSCQTIIPNIAQAYRETIGSKIISISFGIESSPLETLEAAKRIHQANPTIIAFIDHLKHPYDLLKALDKVYGAEKWPRLFFHLYGDFTLTTGLWKKSENLLRGKDVHFFCASPRQQKLVNLFLKQDHQITSVCPFPVSPAEFSYEAGLRETARKKLGFGSSEFVMTYAGRLSLQKNILRLVSDISDSARDLGQDWRLCLAGSFDDMGSPFLGLRLPPQAYDRGLRKKLAELPHEAQRRISILGPLDKRGLKELYHATDLKVSLSTHHDEDFGMAPAEALCCGCPCLLSDWGGFGGFAIDPESVALIPVHLSGTGPKISDDATRLSFLEFAKRLSGQSENRRRERADFFHDHFGVKATKKTLAQAIQTQTRSKHRSFAGFLPILKTHAGLSLRAAKEQAPVFKMSDRIDRTYRLIYQNYLNPAGLQ